MLALLPALLFAWGFLLVRPTLPDVSTCNDTDGAPALDRVAVVVVDGLRWADAPAAFTLSLTPPPGSAWGPTRLVAHPPTATLPAIRSMLTGGLPAGFADAGAGVVYGSPAVAEDTWVGRVRACNDGRREGARARVVAFGDAVWGALLGGERSLDGGWSTPALDVGSLDDSRVWASLKQEVEEWWSEDKAKAGHHHPAPPRPRVAIAHVNALDHAQHARGPGSSSASAALAAISANLTALMRSLTSPAACAQGGDTLLVILGDHGATRDGNHGGASLDETDTAMLAVSARAWCAGGAEALSLPLRAVYTIDLAPALALLLGGPPPFSSVGRLPEGLWGLAHGEATYPPALRANAAQVGQYLKAAPWARRSSAVPQVHALLQAGEGAWARNETGRAVRAWEAGLDGARDAAHANHATFGLWRMGAGLVGLVLVAARRVMLVVSTTAKQQPRRAAADVALPLLLATAHAASLFSVGALQAEAWVVAGLNAALLALAAGKPTPATLALSAAAWACLPLAPRTAAEAMHLVGRSKQQQTALPWALAAAQAGLVVCSQAHPPAAVGVALMFAAHTAFHASGHFCEVAGLKMSLSGGLPYGLAVGVVAADTLAPFFVAGAAARLAGKGNGVEVMATAARTITLSSAALSAAWHARHILAPSVFAPRFMFELAFYASAEIGGWCASK